ncbi:MAG: hypothetical protein DI586_10395 [Micavibrio aeruginosavorus]|uniref:Uncharacterized protein n=1 Tax=Micavibrio aeruginosavorus TaxID=349221 RepID=A0A2W5FJV0_9BACT|nr:MAG: hypothetical protein DI586_10395 [Micavibrio aeruginosavorus]
MKKIFSGDVFTTFNKNIFLQWLVLFCCLLAIRGSEGLGKSVSLDVNDTIVFSQILNNSEIPASSVSKEYITQSAKVGFTLLPAIWMSSLDIPTNIQFLVFYIVQLGCLAFGLLYFFSAFRKDFGFIFLAMIFCYLSGFSGFGRYLAIGAGFKIVTSGFALTIGFIILGLHLRGKQYWAVGLAALLALYHPSHALVLLCILGGYALWENFVLKTKNFMQLTQLGIATLVLLTPFIFFVLLRVPHSDFNHEAWWSYVFSKTSNLTPLQDGLFVVLGIQAALICGIIALKAKAKEEGLKDLSSRAISIIAVTMVLWAVQIIFTELWPSISIAQAALTRVTPYAVITVVAVLAERTYSAMRSIDDKERIYGFLLAGAAIGTAIPPWLPILHIPTMTPPIIDIDYFFQGSVLEQSSIAILIAGLAWWMWLPHLTPEKAKLWTRVMWATIILFITFLGLRLPSLAVLLMLVFHARANWYAKIPCTNKVIIGLLIAACVIVLIARKPWSFSREDNTTEITTLLDTYVPKNGMVLTLPFRSLHSELALPTRAVFLGYGECQYVFYVPSLIDKVWKRAELLGLKPIDKDPEVCSDWLLNPMCRRQYFEAKAKEQNTVWRTNLAAIKKEAPELTHVLMPETMLCKGDKIQAKTSQGLALVPIENAVASNCPMEGKKEPSD